MFRVLTGSIARRLAVSVVVVLAPAWARAEEGGRGFNVVAVPIPISNPALGNGVAVAALGLYKAGGSERPWTTGVAGLYTDNASWAGAAFQKAYLDQDRYRVTAGGIVGQFNIDFYGVGQAAGNRDRSIPIEENAKGGLAEALVRVSPHLYAGLEYRVVDMRTTVDLSQLPFPDMETRELNVHGRISALGLAGEYDTRDSEYAPGRGLYATATVLRAAEKLGGDFDYTRAELTLNGYHRLDEDSVLAWRVSACQVGDGAPFYDLCAYGSANDLRGYVYGRYIDHAMYAAQVEYRRHLFWRLGGVAFAGFGGIDDSFSQMSTRDVLPAVGVGLRFTAAEAYGVNIRFDYAWGKDSEAYYISVGEAF